MKGREKIVPYIAKGALRTEKVNDKGFAIRNTKQEETFLQFPQPNSPQNKLCLITSEDALLRLFFFLKPYLSYQPSEDYPLILRYPLVVDFDEDFLDSVSKGSVKTKVDDTRKKVEDTKKNFEDLCPEHYGNSSRLW